VGLLTAGIATVIARVQGSIKSQIAYSSIAQIGLMFIELSLGWYDVVLIHFAGNAFLRTYQLLVSPSVVTYLIKEQFYHFTPREKTVEDSLPKKIEYSLYMLSLKEFNLDSFMYRYLWNPTKRLGARLSFIRHGWMWALAILALVISYAILKEGQEGEHYRHYFPYVFATIGILLVLKAFTERKLVFWSWGMIIMNHVMVAVAIMFNEQFTWDHVLLYLGGIVVAGAAGYYILGRLRSQGYPVDLDQFHGLSRSHGKLAFAFLLACLGLTGFPITTTFLGEDLIFSHIHEDQWLLALLTGISFILDGLSVIRIYARIFLGPHAESIFEMGYRSS
jgi:NADH:ubiquinone oxidoreductase subunit 5 (subunit L)/multisubunit Na+/H+ antiporter MnhA subunit